MKGEDLSAQFDGNQLFEAQFSLGVKNIPHFFMLTICTNHHYDVGTV